MNFPEAKIALCKCKEGHKIYGVRFERYENGWKATWAFPIKKQGTEKREKYDSTKLSGKIWIDGNYPGCPYCGGKSFIICSCGGLNCNIHGDDNFFKCEWCNITGELTEYTGSGFNSGSDR